jgi:aminopeptidase-like protein
MIVRLQERADVGEAMHDLAADLFPICRSMTGDGVRQTLRRLEELVPLTIHEVPTGEKAFDWEVPREWNIRDAWIADQSGHRIIDFRASNLHVVAGSIPVRASMTWSELKPRLHTLPEHPDWIPYRTAHHREDWGFCLSRRQWEQLEDRGELRYDVVIDSTIKNGSLTYGEAVLPGETDEEMLISTHICHPSLANDNLSGIVVAGRLANELERLRRRYTYRFIFVPATIGAIVWLARNHETLSRIRHGLILSVVGDAGPSTYRRSRRGDAEIDRAFEHVLAHSGEPFTVLDFEPLGYDQRQYCSPGINLPMGCLMRTPNECYPEYHTSADNLDLIRPESLADSLNKCLAAIRVLEGNRAYRNLNPCCEPRLGPRGLYHAFGSGQGSRQLQQAVLWVLNLSDGGHDLLAIAERSNLPFDVIRRAAELLVEHHLLEIHTVAATR